MANPKWPGQHKYLSGMHLVNHGGKCCGIKTVYNMGTKPTEIHSKIEALDTGFNANDSSGYNVSSNMRFFHEAAPQEDGISRLKRYIEYMEKWRPQNMLEVVVMEPTYTDEDYCNQYKHWKGPLEDLGFKEVFSHPNSNSGNICHVFYLGIGSKEVAEPESPEDDDCDDEDRDIPW